jgi:HlyD family secretion protein
VKKLLRKLPLLLFLAGVIAALVYGFRPVPAAVDLAEVKRGPLQVTVEKEGKTRIKQRYMVSAPLAGRMARVLLKPGDRVPADRPLAEIEPVDPTLLDARARAETTARVQEKESNLKRAEAKKEGDRLSSVYARMEHDRLKRLGQGAASLQELENAALKEHTTAEKLKEAELGVKVAKFELAQAQAALTFTEPASPVSPGEKSKRIFSVLSPIDGGKVLRVLKESETIVTPGMEIMEVGDPTRLEAEIDLLTPDAVKVSPGAVVLLEHWGGETLKGTVRLIEPAGFTKTSALGVEEQRVNVIVDFTLPEKYRPVVGDAFRVEAKIIVWEGQDVLKVPAGALFRSRDGWAVFVYSADGKAARRSVKIGHNNGLEAEVLEGLAEGDRVVVHPGDKIKDGVAIAPRVNP